MFLIHLLTVIARLLGPGGAKAVLAENLLVPGEFVLTLPLGADIYLGSGSSTESCSGLLVARAILRRFRMA